MMMADVGEYYSRVDHFNSSGGRYGHTRQPAQARNRGRAIDSGEVHGAMSATAEPELEDLSAQPCRRHRRDGSARGADDRLPPPLCCGHPWPSSATDPIVRCPLSSDRTVDLTTHHRCTSLC